uniref:type II toxin-antitoxin system RelE family toxin n=1 Tax=Pararhizobium sp. IMCC3301 TaxID=3067904 RepID=UPI0027416E4D|nr:type II toxin-antitoxin system RelE/ParE family toxin [Pararhizobium sp. IMCC3301]
MKQVTYTKQAIKMLSRMPASTLRTIRAKIAIYAETPEKLSANVKKLQGVEGFRLRVGDWRVIFNEDAQVVAVLKVAPRGSAYS